MENARYHRQILLPQIGKTGQRKLNEARVLLIGCGALGSTIAEQLARAGVGNLRIADRDIVELTNLQRQVLFDENDARDGLPKAIAAANRLAKINSQVVVEPKIVDVDSDNIDKLVEGVNLILDGTDNVATRYLINDISVKNAIPWIYGACVGTEGRVMMLRPGQRPCLRCIFPEPPDPQQLPTCDTAGVLGPVASAVGSLQALAAIKFLSGNTDAVAQEMLVLDLWTNRIRAIATADARRNDCPACGQRRFEFLDSRQSDVSAKLCGRSAVQVRSTSKGRTADLAQVAQKLRAVGMVQETPFMVRCVTREEALSLTVFQDGRVIVGGTTDLVRAKSLVARFVGS